MLSKSRMKLRLPHLHQDLARRAGGQPGQRKAGGIRDEAGAQRAACVVRRLYQVLIGARALRRGLPRHLE
jgi:hypothetical protein